MTTSPCLSSSVFPHPHHRLSAKLNLPIVSHTFTHKTSNRYTISHTTAVKGQAQFSSLSHTQLQIMTEKTAQCWVKATCTWALLIVHILTHKRKQRHGQNFKQKLHVIVQTHVKGTYGRKVLRDEHIHFTNSSVLVPTGRGNTMVCLIMIKEL